MKAQKIRTPRGKLVSVARYLGLVTAQEMRYGASSCSSGHYGCAAWAGGPCSAELAANAESEEES
jgi:hypothetical protein